MIVAHPTTLSLIKLSLSSEQLLYCIDAFGNVLAIFRREWMTSWCKHQNTAVCPCQYHSCWCSHAVRRWFIFSCILRSHCNANHLLIPRSLNKRNNDTTITGHLKSQEKVHILSFGCEFFKKNSELIGSRVISLLTALRHTYAKS